MHAMILTRLPNPPLLDPNGPMGLHGLELVKLHRPVLLDGLFRCLRCGDLWMCRQHATGEDIVRMAGLYRPWFDDCDRVVQDLEAAYDAPIEAITAPPPADATVLIPAVLVGAA